MQIFLFQRILTTEWIDGIKINNVKELKNKGLNIYDIDTKLITLMAEQIFHTGFVHSDPHPGNSNIFLVYYNF